MVNLTPAGISDNAGAQQILEAIRKRWPWLKKFFADSAYDRAKLMDKAAYLDFVVEIIKRIEAEPGFKVVPRRWVVVLRTMLPSWVLSGHPRSSAAATAGC